MPFFPNALERVEKARARHPAGTPGGKGGEFAPAMRSGSYAPGQYNRDPKTGKWMGADGKPASAAVQERLRAVKMPPSYQNVTLNADASHDMVAIGRSPLTGGWKRFYTDSFHARQASKKFARVAAFLKDAPGIVKKAGALAGKDDAATSLFLIARTGMRPGGGSGSSVFGATTLQARHVTVRGSSVRFQFVGKGGKQLDLTFNDRELAGAMSKQLRGKRGADSLFNTTVADSRRFLRESGGRKYKVKDFRTAAATNRAAELVSQRQAPRSQAELKRVRREIATDVSSRLGNTPGMALKAYIHPQVWTQWESGLMSETPRAGRRRRKP
jgi:DNA topoisomerase-1